MRQGRTSHDAYRCPACGGQIRKTMTEDLPGNWHSYIWQCRSCWKEFGLEWTEEPGQKSDTATILVGAEPWTTTETREPTLEGMLRQVGPQPTNWGDIALRAAPAVLIAFISIVLVLEQLLQRTGRVLQGTLI
jgi:DNA-directed RNA polymerase subunit RPC12/RpoP